MDMRCPVCKNQKYSKIGLHSDGFYEDIAECTVCATTWSMNHGAQKIIKDPYRYSFLEGPSESVEGDDYGLV